MPPTDTSKPSFSSGRRWLGALNMAAAALAALALAIMFNYLAAGHYLHLQLSRDAAFKLSAQTRAVLNSLTNDVQATIFFDPNNPNNQDIYALTRALLAEYETAKPGRIHVSFLDYTRFVGKAKELLTKYNLTGAQAKDFVLFECNGHHKIVYSRDLSDYDFSDLISGRSNIVPRTAFRGELLFTSGIYAVSHPQPLKTYFLYGHFENNPGNPSGEPENLGGAGYSKFAAILTNEIDGEFDRLSLLGTNDIPRDCQLLIVAGPRRGQFLPEEVTKISAYLKNSGRLLALLSQPCGLEPMLASQWGVGLGESRVEDRDPRFTTKSPHCFFTANLFPHAVINPLCKDKMAILMVWPRPLYRSGEGGKTPGAPEVSFLAETSTNSIDEAGHAGAYYLLAAVDQGGIKGVDTPRGGGTRIVVAGDSTFLDDEVIDSWPVNHQFAYLALNWLLQRPPLLLEGLVPQPIKEYRLVMTPSQSLVIRWLFLGAMPAAVLALGGLVWLRRRN